MHITVGICTFRRASVIDTLDSVASQALPPGASLEVVVADNDEHQGLQDQVTRHAAAKGLALRYLHAPARNISIARNACLEAARGACLIFIDDDEIADADWILRLVTAWRESGSSVVFGPAFAVYPDAAPRWMRDNDFHSNIPSRNRGIVETGYSSNVLLDLSDPRVATARFDPAFGRTGGEDVDFFFRLHRAGVEMAIAHEASVREYVTPTRMSFGWLLRRRYMTGAIYGTCVSPDNLVKRAGVFLRSAAKAGYCGLRMLLASLRTERSSFWIMRGMFHLGVLSGCITPPRREIYGRSG